VSAPLTLNGKTTLKRLERLAQRHHSQPDDAQRRERERLDAMTDDQLARELEALAYVWELVEQWQRDAFSD
jgi:predicted ATPase